MLIILDNSPTIRLFGMHFACLHRADPTLPLCCKFVIGKDDRCLLYKLSKKSLHHQLFRLYVSGYFGI